MSAMFILILLAVVCLWLIYARVKRRKCDAPGPMGLPIFGYGPFLGAEQHITLRQLSNKYGDVCLVHMGMVPTVVLNGPAAIREAFSRHEFNSRPTNVFIFNVYNRYGGKISFRQNDTVYSYMRKCAAKAVAIFTSSNTSHLPHVCSAGFAKLKNIIDSNISEPINLREPLWDMLIYIVGTLSFGNQFEEDSHPFFQSYKEWIHEENVAGGHSEFAVSMPFLRPLFYRSQRLFERITEEVMMQQRDLVKNHKKRADGRICDIQDALDAMADVQSDLNIRSKLGITTDDIKGVGLDLFGFATTAEHLLMGLAIIALHTDIQEKLYREIVDLLGVGGQVLPEHLVQLPYFQAFQHELLRFFSHLPLGLHHATSTDVNFRGYFIPKGTTVLANFYSVHYDPQIFANPNEFDPERFLNADGTANSLAENLVAFGVGHRKCPAEKLAQQELFTITAKLVSNYRVKLHWYDAEKPLQCDIGITLTAKNFTCLFEKRNCRNE